MARSTPHVLTIPPGHDFSRVLVAALLDEDILGMRYREDPLALADLIIYVPTQRLREAVESSFAKALAPRPAILPRIRPLAEPGDPLELMLAQANIAGLPFGPDITHRDITTIERQFLLLPDVMGWQKTIRERRGEDEPTSARARAAELAEGLSLADALGRLIDEMAMSGTPLERLANVESGDFDPAGFDEYWSLTREFLRLAAIGWPARLAKMHAQDSMTQRLGRIEAEAATLARLDPKTPVIVAGSTGSVHATARLMRSVARLDRGAVILPGLDTMIAREDEGSIWPLVGAQDANFATRFAHPQVSLKRSIEEIGIRVEDVRVIGVDTPAINARNRLIMQALRPAETSGNWRKARENFPIEAALDGLRVIVAQDEREEALAIAILMRETLETPGNTVALVTGDRSIARRVRAELRRWGISAEDSAGSPLAESKAGSLLRLFLAAAEDRDAVSILTLLRHPLFRLGLETDELARLTDALEILVFRGRYFGQHLPMMERVVLALNEEDRRLAPAGKRIASETLDALSGFARAIDSELLHFDGASPDASLATLVAQLKSALMTLTALPGGHSMLDVEQSAEAVLALIDEIALAADENPVPCLALRGILETALASRISPEVSTAHPRAFILGLLEARLVAADRIILAGLNEGVFPGVTPADPFLNRAMRLTLGLQPPEWRIGQSAHDFTMLAGHADITLTRAVRSGGQPSTPSRFLRRLQAFIGASDWRRLMDEGAETLDLARRLDAPGPFAPIEAPDIIPDAPRIPQKLSITEIETLRRDPYAIYAKHLLDLTPLDELDPEPDGRERGTILHDVLETYSRGTPPDDPDDASAQLRDIGTDALRRIAHEPELHRFWWQTFEAIIPGYVAFDRERRGNGTRIFLEERARHDLSLPEGMQIRISGAADRLEIAPDGALTIIDYKSGVSSPRTSMIAKGLAPQLTITGALALRGAFRALGAVQSIAGLAYLPISGKAPVTLKSVGSKTLHLDTLIASDWDQLIKELAAYAAGSRGYRSRIATFRQDESRDYDHLSRVGEWSLGGIEDEDVTEGSET